MLRRTAILLHTAALTRALTATPLFAANAAKKLRPSKDDVDRISWGKPSKKKGVGSRGTPHRLNEAERAEYDRAKARGYVEVAGSAWRKERRDAPLLNTWRNWCDAVAALLPPRAARDFHETAGLRAVVLRALGLVQSVRRAPAADALFF